MEKRYKVVTIAVSGKGNKVFRTGDIVTANQLNYDAEKMVRDGYLKVLGGDETTSPSTQPAQQATTVSSNQASEQGNSNENKEQAVLFVAEFGDKKIEVRNVDDLNKKQIVQLLDDRDAEFDRTKNKEVLFNILLDYFK